MMLPRLHLAIEHNHKEFVGHPLCQQVFMQSYRQGVPFHGHSFIFQILHLILQIILSPILVAMTLFIWIGKNVSQRCGINKDIPALFGYKKWHVNNVSWIRKSINAIIDFAFYTKLSLEVPLNRFIIDTGYYIIFVAVLGYTVLNKSFGLFFNLKPDPERGGRQLSFAHLDRVETYREPPLPTSQSWQPLIG
mgnify:CR=1 FL=1